MVTPLQHKIYAFIQSYIEQHGYAPAFAEIAEGIQISKRSVSLISRSVHALANAGWLTLHKKGYRNIEIAAVQKESPSGSRLSKYTLPLLGRIAAGAPIEAISDQQMLDLTPFIKDGNHFVLEVKGDSMIEEGIHDGDFVICKKVNHAHEGDVVVALVDKHEATLKRLSYKLSGYITLVPANSLLKPKSYKPERIQIQGIFVGLLRLKNK